jgi:hypothetical protein
MQIGVFLLIEPFASVEVQLQRAQPSVPKTSSLLTQIHVPNGRRVFRIKSRCL